MGQTRRLGRFLRPSTDGGLVAVGVTAPLLIAARITPSSRLAVDRHHVRHDGSAKTPAAGQRRKILATRQPVSFIAFHLVAESDHD